MHVCVQTILISGAPAGEVHSCVRVCSTDLSRNLPIRAGGNSISIWSDGENSERGDVTQ